MLAARRYREGYDFFRERSQAEPGNPLYLTLAGVFEARLDGAVDDAIGKLDAAAERDLGLPQYFRGVTLAEFPDCAGRAETVVSDLEFVLAVRDRFPAGFMRAVHRALAVAYRSLDRQDEADTEVPLLITDSWVTAEDGFRFGPPRLVEKAPGVYVAQGYDFADFSFVVTDSGIVAVDTGGDPRHARAALQDLRRITSAPEKLTVGGVDFALYPIPGGETHDGLVVHLPDRGIVFTGDMNMPYLGAPFFPEGSAEGLFEAMQLVADLEPRLLIHGHTPLTETYSIETFPGLLAALRELRDLVVAAVGEGRTLVEILHRNHLPDVLREHPNAVMPYIITRDHFIQRIYEQRTGYWRPGGEGIEHFAPAEWAAALDILGGGSADAFVSAGTELLDRGDHALALQLTEYGRLRHPDSTALGICDDGSSTG
ncbi:MAG: hypothetical protein GEV03_13795 [Streptosporangiales bacterium]|nr:hypothetical protein [Streptosporangiales bacterium]